MFGNLGEMANLLKKVKDIQKNMAELKAEMARSEYSASSADNEVVVVVSGDFQVKKVTVSPAADSVILPIISARRSSSVFIRRSFANTRFPSSVIA